jgi:hypothetical protein
MRKTQAHNPGLPRDSSRRQIALEDAVATTPCTNPYSFSTATPVALLCQGKNAVPLTARRAAVEGALPPMGTHRHRVDDDNPYPPVLASGPAGSVGLLVVDVGSVMARMPGPYACHAHADAFVPRHQRVRKVRSQSSLTRWEPTNVTSTTTTPTPGPYEWAGRLGWLACRSRWLGNTTLDDARGEPHVRDRDRTVRPVRS